MKAYLVLHSAEGKNADDLHDAMKQFRIAEPISDHASIIVSFYSEEDILSVLDKSNPNKLPILVTALPGSIYTKHLPLDYFEPSASEKI